LDTLLLKRVINRYEVCFRSVTGKRYYKLKTSPRTLTVLDKMVDISKAYEIDPEEWITIQFTRFECDLDPKFFNPIHLISHEAIKYMNEIMLPEESDINVHQWFS